MNIDAGTLEKGLENLLYGISIPFRFLNLLLPDEWEIALLILSIICAGFVGVKIYLRKIHSY